LIQPSIILTASHHRFCSLQNTDQTNSKQNHQARNNLTPAIADISATLSCAKAAALVVLRAITAYQIT